MLLRVPYLGANDGRRAEEAIVNDNNEEHDHNINNGNKNNNDNDNDSNNDDKVDSNNDNDNNNDNDDDGPTFDVRWVPSLFTLSNTDRIALFSDADVFFAPHGDKPILNQLPCTINK